MCGIYGMVSLAGEDQPLRHPELLSRMAERLRHRGPDATGGKTSRNAALGSERLRIRDIRPRADQPFEDAYGRWLVCNGEIYNAPTLRQGHPFHSYRSHSDVEPLVPLLADRGPQGLSEVDGMFALAWWNPVDQSLLLARDRAGEKPLFYLEMDAEVWFASEVQALMTHPRFRPTMDEVALMDYAAFGYVREPHTLFRQVRKVPAGSFMRFAREGITTGMLGFPNRTCISGDPKLDVVTLRSLLRAAVAKQIQADVPVGVFCSGGLDSSLVAVLAANAVGAESIRTFSISFPDRSFDEGRYARRLANALGVPHGEAVADTASLTRALTTVATRVAEPVADPAILPTLILAERAKQDVGVVLSGEGADELFGGYPTYLGHLWARRCKRVPRPIQKTAGTWLRRPAASLDRIPIAMLAERFVNGLNLSTPARHVTWFGTSLFPYLPRDHQDRIVASLEPALDDPTAWSMHTDFRTYLREGLLVKLDRATMLVSLEARAPFLDAQIIEFARQLPRNRKVTATHGKVILREAGRGTVPPWILRRRKHGLSVPIGTWINGDLRQEVDRVLAGDRGGAFTCPAMNDIPVSRLLDQHRQGSANHSRPLWALFVLQLWFERWGSGG